MRFLVEIVSSNSVYWRIYVLQDEEDTISGKWFCKYYVFLKFIPNILNILDVKPNLFSRN